MSAVAPGEVEPPLTLRHRPELLPTIVPPDVTVQFSLTLPLQVYRSAVAFGAVDAPVTLRHRPLPFTTVPLELTVQCSWLSPSQVLTSAVVFSALEVAGHAQAQAR